MWAGLQHEDKENECVVCLRPVSLKALLCFNALHRCERVAALFVFNHRSRNEQRKQMRCTMGAGRSSLPPSHRFFGRKPQGKPRVRPPSFITSTLTRYGCSALWPIHKSGHAWMCAYTHTHTRSQELFLCLTLYFISFLTSSHSQTESTRSQIFVFLHPAFWTFWPLMEISLPWKLFR